METHRVHVFSVLKFVEVRDPFKILESRCFFALRRLVLVLLKKISEIKKKMSTKTWFYKLGCMVGKIPCVVWQNHQCRKMFLAWSHRLCIEMC